MGVTEHWLTYAGLTSEINWKLDDDTELVHFGAPFIVRMYGHTNPVLARVSIDPDGTYFGWQDAGKEEEIPTLIQPRRVLFEVQFPYSPEAAQKVGKGRIVKLSVKRMD